MNILSDYDAASYVLKAVQMAVVPEPALRLLKRHLLVRWQELNGWAHLPGAETSTPPPVSFAHLPD